MYLYRSRPRGKSARRLARLMRSFEATSSGGSGGGSVAGSDATVTLRGHTARVRRIAVLPRSRCVVTGCADGSLRVYSAADGSLQRRIAAHTPGENLGVSGVAVLSRRVVVSCGASDGRVRCWDVVTGEMLGEALAGARGDSLSAGDAGAWAVAVLGPGQIVVGMGFGGDLVCYTHVRGRDLVEVARVSGAHRNYVCEIAVYDNRFVTASGDCTAAVWDSRTLERLATLKGHKHRVACVTVNEHFIATGSVDKTVRLYDARSFNILHAISGLHEGTVHSVQLIGRSLLLSTAADRRLCMTDLVVGAVTIKSRSKMPFPVRDAVVLCDGQIGIVGDACGATVILSPWESAEAVRKHARAQVAVGAVMCGDNLSEDQSEATARATCGRTTAALVGGDLSGKARNSAGVTSFSFDSLTVSD